MWILTIILLQKIQQFLIKPPESKYYGGAKIGAIAIIYHQSKKLNSNKMLNLNVK